ncbi:hypothetical protein AA106555_1883 [Neokomagataea thailandica NBRC 106555]|uniref:Gluconate 2-dehydrogenase subunit 3 family protein n=2 Tax=Neokomagataea TaxID=1223423 RepID=A0A4Y6V6U3_9PROT|nr:MULTISPECIES: gluconate 2-dehydrogenase subunit 3 family protein [Neokomagataea]QDH24588.1 gluconate 2-dehydrogenase subunit 3 family protein [Neokomagataea tanensis]GBR54967.1 hypothetical protein AA106555_1883 [Neokomagataea thailandica NBRC 106555]
MTTSASSSDILQSDRLTSRTKAILQARRTPEENARTLSPKAYTALTTLVSALLPQDELIPGKPIDLPAAVDRALTGPRDGWRFAELPSDAAAWETALLTVSDYVESTYNKPLSSLSVEEGGALLDRIAEGAIGLCKPDRFSAFQMQRWSGDFRADVIDAFMGHPDAHQALGISAYLNGNNSSLSGFQCVTPDTPEAFEPKASSSLASLPVTEL